MLKRSKGFTLIELLVVIAIIAVLSIFFINTAQINVKRSRDARRKTDLENIRSGIETFFSDCAKYPATLTAGSSLKGDGSSANCLAANTYIQIIPDDPISGRDYSYSRGPGTTAYTICAALETGSGSVSCGGSSSCGSATCNYQVTNP